MRALYILTHVVSQQLNRYLRCPGSVYDAYRVPYFSEFDLQDWIAFIDSLLSQVTPEESWLPHYFLTHPDPKEVATRILTHLKICRDHQTSVLTSADPEYPFLLRHIGNPPHSVLIQGNLDVLSKPLLSIVGSRRCSVEAGQHAFDLGRKAALLGASIVSGGAYGCDIRAHQGVLSTSLDPVPAVVVFAGGFPRLYPSGNDRYFREILERGGILLTERMWGQAAKRYDFPVRNRIIAGLSRITVLVQAAYRSGAMVTAKLALDQGREVLVFQYEEEDPWATGNQGMIAEGADFIFSADEFIRMVRFHDALA